MPGGMAAEAGGADPAFERDLQRWRNFWHEQRPTFREQRGEGAQVSPSSPMQSLIDAGRAANESHGVLARDPSQGEGDTFVVNTPRGAISIDRERWDDVERDTTLYMDQRKLRSLAERILDTDDITPGELLNLWNDAIAQMEHAHALGMDPRNPWHWLEQQANSAEADRVSAEEAENLVRETIQRSINLTDPDTAEMALRATMRRLLRRDASDSEIAAFVGALNAKERANPTVTTSTTTPGEPGEEPTVTEQTTEGGTPDAGTFAEMHIDDMFAEERDVQMVGNEFFSAVQQAIGSVA